MLSVIEIKLFFKKEQSDYLFTIFKSSKKEIKMTYFDIGTEMKAKKYVLNSIIYCYYLIRETIAY